MFTDLALAVAILCNIVFCLAIVWFGFRGK